MGNPAWRSGGVFACDARNRQSPRLRTTTIVHLVQLLLPLYDNAGSPFPRTLYERVTGELTRTFGGLTAYTRSPAEGLWREQGEGTQRDDIVVYEVMAESLDDGWWRRYREELERRFAQDRLVVRAQETRLL